jgi:hypothetical protein
VVGVLTLGLSMTVLSNLRERLGNSEVITLAVYEIITQFMMFFVLMDVCRRSEKLAQPRSRALFVFLILFVNAFLPLPLLTALSWNVWRRAIFLKAEGLAAKDRKERIEVKPE